ncbi:MAG: NirA family protein [Thiohalocapsa sp.]
MQNDAFGFSDAQKQYLEGFMRGVAARHGIAPGPRSAPPAEAGSPGDLPADIHHAAQDRFLVAGRKLTPEEEAKRRQHPLDQWDEIVADADAGRFPKGTDIFLRKFFGLFYVAPAQNAFMCRLRIPNGILETHQARAVAAIAERHAGGTADVTTRANLQLREIRAESTIEVLTALQDCGLTSRGAGADNVRNITGSPLAGIDPQELIDTRPFARALHHHILNHRELYGLPRKFNIAFDGGGSVSVLADTNDIGFMAASVPGDATAAGGLAEGVYFRLLLGGVTRHGDFARDAGVLVRAADCVRVAVAVVRVFIAHGDRTDRERARLKYLLDDWGVDRFLAEVERELGQILPRLPLGACRPRGTLRKHGHVGVHQQRQPGRNYIGVVLPVGRLTGAQLRGLADIAARFGSGTLRLTVWQNLVISDIADDDVATAEAAIAGLGLGTTASGVRGGIVACTGNTGCKFAATDTKGAALRLADHLDRRLALAEPVNIHLTGCPNSCAQHYVGDIGLLGKRLGDEMIEGYAVLLGGGGDSERALAREIYPDVAADEVAIVVERMLRGFLAHRQPQESLQAFAARHSVEGLRALFDATTLPDPD